MFFLKKIPSTFSKCLIENRLTRIIPSFLFLAAFTAANNYDDNEDDKEDNSDDDQKNCPPRYCCFVSLKYLIKSI